MNVEELKHVIDTQPAPAGTKVLAITPTGLCFDLGDAEVRRLEEENFGGRPIVCLVLKLDWPR